MSYLIETDRAVDWLNGRPEARELLNLLMPEGLRMSLISYGEVYEGIYYGQDRALRLEVFSDFLRIVRVMPLDRLILERFARERGHLRRQGTPIADMDLLIAATAVEHELILVTRNLRHYQRVRDLQIYGTHENGP